MRCPTCISSNDTAPQTKLYNTSSMQETHAKEAPEQGTRRKHPAARSSTSNSPACTPRSLAHTPASASSTPCTWVRKTPPRSRNRTPRSSSCCRTSCTAPTCERPCTASCALVSSPALRTPRRSRAPCGISHRWSYTLAGTRGSGTCAPLACLLARQQLRHNC